MNRLVRLALIPFSLLPFCVPAAAQKAHHPVAVSVTCTCDDVTGRAYVSALKAALAKSTHYREVNAAEAGEDDTIRINIISMPLPEDDGRPQSALSIVCLHDGSLMHQFVETCTHIPIADCAQTMIASLAQWDGPAA